MVRGIGNRVKISQIIANQLPNFIIDNIEIVEEKSIPYSSSGTYVRSDRSVTITSINHGLSIGELISVEYLSGFGTNGYYEISDIIDIDNFKIIDEVSGSTSGSLNYQKYSQILSKEKTILRSEPGSYDKFIAFLRQYYISQEYQGGPTDIIDNLNEYISLDNLVPEVIVSNTKLLSSITADEEVISVISTKGFPEKYGLLKIDDEIITYTSKDTSKFYGCIRGFSGITNYHDDYNYEEIIFSKSDASSHTSNSNVENLSSLFLKEFYKKIKYTLVPGLENTDFIDELNIGNFIKESRSLYECKGTEESFKILFKILFGIDVSLIDTEKYLIKPSSSNYIRRNVAIAESISGNLLNLRGQNIFKQGDTEVSASVSNIEPFTRRGKIYYKIFLFIGYDDSENYVTGNFNITSSTKSLDSVTINSTSNEVVTVDSTVGFANSGYFLYEGKKIFYYDKTLTQFLGCHSESEIINIEKTKNITSSEIYYGFENGNINNKVEFRIGGVLNKIKFVEKDNFNYLVGDEIYVKSLGEVIKNPEFNKTKLEVFANSWIYNTSCRFNIDKNTISGSQFSVLSEIDSSSLKIGDNIEFLENGTESVISGLESAVITSIVDKNITVSTNIENILSSERYYDIRRIQNKASTTNPANITIKYGNNKIVSDILNVYKEENFDGIGYVASHSLPSYEINSFINSYNIQSVEDFDSLTGKYSTIVFSDPVSLVTGNKVSYVYSETPISDLENNSYYVEIINAERTKIKLYFSRSLIGTTNFVQFSVPFGVLLNGQHKIILSSQLNTEVSPQKILRKFDIDISKNNEYVSDTPVGSIGMLVNGTEILGYKTNDKIYYGPINSVDVLNTGIDYDVINPPLIELSDGEAKVQPVISGHFDSILVSKQDFKISDNIIISASGGNGSGAVFEPIITNYQRELKFDSRQITNGGGIDIDLETITFLSEHNLVNGQEVIYDSNGNDELGISSYFASNADSGLTLVNGEIYYIDIVNDKTIQLYPSKNDYSSGINTIGITTIGNSGIHKFRTPGENTLSGIAVIDGGSGYTNRKLIVKPSNIFTSYNEIYFKNHGFNDGELVTYSHENIGIETSYPISGLSTNNYYYILKIDDERFSLSDAGIGGTITENYEYRRITEFNSNGIGYQVFKYPDISVNILYSSPGIGTTSVISIEATPIVKGSIIDMYVYEPGTGYGTSIINLNTSPDITIKNGSSAQIFPIISNGEIVDIQILSGGYDYYSTPELVVKSDSGYGAILKPIIINNMLDNVVILNPGTNYDSKDTTIDVVPLGKNAKFNVNIRPLTINNAFKYGRYLSNGLGEFYRKCSDEVISNYDELTMQYMLLTYSSKLMNIFSDDGTTHSPIIGWAYDGNPIYGPYGYENPEDSNSQIKLLQSGYSNYSVVDRPDGFDNGAFIDDYEFTNSGDLDRHNGRFCKTPEFPYGTYAYFATVKNDIYSGDSIGQFPYFIGNFYRSFYDESEVKLTHEFDFNSSNLIRNTLPYKVGDRYSDNDFIIESNEILSQKAILESINSGYITNFNIISSGDGYAVGDKVVYENEPSLLVKVSEILGKDVLQISNTNQIYENSILTWISNDTLQVNIDPYHDLEADDIVNVSGFSTNLISVSNYYNVGLSTYSTTLSSPLSNTSTTGIVTTIGISYFPTNISIGTTIKIDSELMEVVEVFNSKLALKVKRSSSGVAHTSTTRIDILPNKFLIKDSKLNVPFFDSQLNKKVYFSTTDSVAIGTDVGITSSLSTYINGTNYTREIPNQSIYLENHPFTNNEKVILYKDESSSPIVVFDGNKSFNIPESGNYQTLYVLNKSKNYIGLVTSVGINTGLSFESYSGTENYLFSLETDYYQENCTVIKNKSTIITKESHNLSNGDSISVLVSPKSNVGLGTTSVKVKYDENAGLLLIDEINISSGINTENSTITINSHNFTSGDVVYYNSTNSIAEGLSTGRYYTTYIDRNTIKLSTSYLDSISSPPNNVSINGDPGGNGQTLSKINPKISVIKNNKLSFDLSDPSLSGYELKIYYDNDFQKEFISTGDESIFELSRIGDAGISENAELILNCSDCLPNIVYYSLEKSGYISTADKTNRDYSKIEFIDSKYNGIYNIFGVGTTTFSFSLKEYPEFSNYTENDCDLLQYATSSKSSSGPISKVKSFTKNIKYKNIPNFESIISENGVGGYVVPVSSDIGTPKDVKIVINGFDYSSDKTLRPSAATPTEVVLTNSHIIESVEVISSGNNYLSVPDIVVINPITYEEIDGGILKANISGSTIGSIDVEVSPKGLPETPAIIKTINNSNGIFIERIESSSSGIVTCILTTPIVGFSSDPFKPGDKIFVENIIKYSTDGDGFNSSDYNYQFFEVTAYYSGSNPGKLEYDLSSLTTNPGIAQTNQNSFASIINEKNYPVLKPIQSPVKFNKGEKLQVNNGLGFSDENLIVKSSDNESLRIFGTYDLSPGYILRGSESGSIGEINSIKTSTAKFEISSYSVDNLGWLDDIGMLSESTQVIEDNDYYQNLSYSIKSTKTWDEISSPVNNLLHTSGLKNFSDTEFISISSVGISSVSDSVITIISDIINESRVDTINYFDLNIDIDISQN